MKAFFGVMPALQPIHRRQLEKMGIIGTSALSANDSSRFTQVSLNMKGIYSTATITAGGKPGLSLEPGTIKLIKYNGEL